MQLVYVLRRAHYSDFKISKIKIKYNLKKNFARFTILIMARSVLGKVTVKSNILQYCKKVTNYVT